RSDVTTEVQGLMSAGRRLGQPAKASTRVVLLAFIWPIYVTDGSKLRIWRLSFRVAACAVAPPASSIASTAVSSLRMRSANACNPENADRIRSPSADVASSCPVFLGSAFIVDLLSSGALPAGPDVPRMRNEVGAAMRRHRPPARD